jgi:hypothetical protein
VFVVFMVFMVVAVFCVFTTLIYNLFWSGIERGNRAIANY